jgi:hypothetical protein
MPKNRLYEKTSRGVDYPPWLAFLWGNLDYTKTMAVVKVSFLLNNLGDRFAEH